MADAETGSALDDFLGRPKPTFLQLYGKWIAVALGVVLLVLLAMRLFAGSSAIAYQTQPVTRGSLAVTVTATGNLAPTNQIEIGSEISGIVTKVLVDVNDQVAKGQAIALVDPSRLEDATRQSEAALSANRAAVGQAQATVEESNAQLGRLREVSRLSGGRVPAKTEMEAAVAASARAVAALRSAQANVVAAEAQLSSNRTQQSKAIIRSPVSGVVLTRSIDPGQTVAASFNTPTLFVIAEDLTQMKLEVAVDEADVGQVRAGQAASFTVDAYPGQSFPARLTRVDLGAKTTATSTTAASASSVVAYSATLTVGNPELKLRPGMTATATIAVQNARDVLLVPNAALRFTPDSGTTTRKKSSIVSAMGPPQRRSGNRAAQQRTIGVGSRQTVYVLGADGQPSPVAVITGPSDGRNTEVKSRALKAGDVVITGRKAAADG